MGRTRRREGGRELEDQRGGREEEEEEERGGSDFVIEEVSDVSEDIEHHSAPNVISTSLELLKCLLR